MPSPVDTQILSNLQAIAAKLDDINAKIPPAGAPCGIHTDLQELKMLVDNIRWHAAHTHAMWHRWNGQQQDASPSGPEPPLP